MQYLKPNKLFSFFTYLVLSSLIFITPIIRYLKYNTFFVAGENYLFLNSIKTNSFDNLFYYVLKFIPINEKILIFIIPFIFSLLSLYLFSQICKIYFKNIYEYYVAISFFILSSVFILLNTGVQIMSLLLLLSLFAIYSFTKKNYFQYISTFLLSLFFPILTLFLIPFIIYYKYKEINSLIRLFFVIIISFTSILFLAYLNLDLNYIIFDSLNVVDSFSFLGGQYGYAFLIVIFGILGVINYYKKSNKTCDLVCFIVYALLSGFNSELRIFMMVFLTIFASEYFYHFVIKKWFYENLVYAFVVLVFCIFFFSLSTSIQDEINSPPFQKEIDALEFLSKDMTFKNISNKEAFLLTDLSYNYFVEYYANIKPYNIENTKREHISKSLFYSRKYSYISEILESEKIYYVLVDDKMVNGNIWGSSNEDLLFVLKNNIHFKKIYDKNNIQIYYYDQILKDAIILNNAEDKLNQNNASISNYVNITSNENTNMTQIISVFNFNSSLILNQTNNTSEGVELN
jgi:hypothetical protein